MFLRSQLAIDKFDAYFRETEDGQIVFQPKDSDLAVPVSLDEYQGMMAEYERVHARNMFFMWIVLLGAGGYGLYMVLAEDSYASFFIIFGAAMIFNISLQTRDGLKVIQPIIDRRTEMKNAAKTQNKPQG